MENFDDRAGERVTANFCYSSSMLKRALKALYRIAPASLLNRAANLIQPHFTVTVAAVILNDDRRVLLLKHTFRNGNGWGLPGGFITKGEQPEKALRRELREETGLEIENVELALVRTVRTIQQVQIVFRCDSIGEPKVESIEIERCEWFQIEEAYERLNRDQRAIIERALSQKEKSRA